MSHLIVAHYEPPHQDLRCLQTQLLSSLVLKELILKPPQMKNKQKEKKHVVEFANNIDPNIYCKP